MLTNMHENPQPFTVPPEPLPPPFDRLVTDQTLTDDNGGQVMRQGTVPAHRDQQTRRLIEDIEHTEINRELRRCLLHERPGKIGEGGGAMEIRRNPAEEGFGLGV